MPPSEVETILELLDSLIALRKIKVQDLERRLGMSAGTIRRILNGRIELKFRHITDILAVLEMPTRTFFKIAYESNDLAEAQSRLAGAHRMAHHEPHQLIALSPSELEAVVVAAIERIGLNVRPPEPPQGTSPSKKPKPPGSKKPRSPKKKDKPEDKDE